MAQRARVRGLVLLVNNDACAHSCAYCSTGRKRSGDVSMARLERIVERLMKWRDHADRADFGLHLGFGHAANHEVPVLKQLLALRDRMEGTWRPPKIHLGGLHRHSRQEMLDWLRLRRDECGVTGVHASLAGYGEVHDRWNRRSGDFGQLTDAMAAAAELGLEIEQRIFIVKSTLPTLDRLTAALDAISPSASRYYCLFYYRGLGTRLEHERLHEEHRAELPDYVHSSAVRSEEWHSERHWIGLMENEDEAFHDVSLKLYLTDDEVERVERLSCEEIVSDLEARTHAAFAALPARSELCRLAGDRSNTRLYSDRTDVETKWLDKYLTLRPMAFERNFTHLWTDF